MAYTPENNPYIPGDPYSYDLKWVVSEINKWKTSENAVEAAAASAQAAGQKAEDAAASAEAAADSAQAAAGSEAAAKDYADNIANPVSGLVSTWLNANITQPTTPAVDASLTVSGAAADAKIAGNDIRSILNGYLKDSYNIFTEINSVPGVIDASGNVIFTENVYTTDFLSCQPNTLYYNSCVRGNWAEFYAIGFYNRNKEFISRDLTRPHEFTTPEDCYFIKVSSMPAYNGFREYTVISANAQYPFVYSKTIGKLNVEGLTQLFIRSGMLDFVKNDCYDRLLITDNNIWGFLSTGYHICIPVMEGEQVTIKTDASSSAYALLKSNSYKEGAAPDFNNIYTWELTPEGSTVWTDTGNIDTRHLITAKKVESFIIPPNTNFLYISAMYNNISTLPAYLKIGNNIIIDNPIGNTIQYDTIFFDDFNEDLSNWDPITQDIPAENPYNSRFVSNADTISLIDSCLVLKAVKDAGNNGSYRDFSGNIRPIEYISGYISSDRKIAIQNGRISARIKAEFDTSKNMFPWAFWTFGQNASWAIAHEMDIAEEISSITAQEITAADGTIIPAGSVLSNFGNHVHYRNTSDVNSQSYRAYSINYALGGISAADTNFYKILNIDARDWHTYSVEWNEDIIQYFIDDNLVGTTKKSDINIVESGFSYPQDIRFNIKATQLNSQNSGYLLVDWIRVEVANLTPCLSISYPDINLNVGDSINIYPTFNPGCSNKAFELSTEANNITIQRYSTDVSKQVINKLTAISAGSALVSMTTPEGITGSFTVNIA